MTKRWQYQGLFEPVSTSPETTVIDKWYQRTSEPVRVIPQPLRTDYFFFVDFTVPAIETVTVDKWFVPLSEPVIVRPPLNQTTYDFFVDFTVPVETVTLDKWFREASIPLYGIPRNNATFPVMSFLDIEDTTEPTPSVGIYKPVYKPRRR